MRSLVNASYPAPAAAAVAAVIVAVVWMGSSTPDTAWPKGGDATSTATPAPARDCPPTTPYPAGTVTQINYVPLIQLGDQRFIAQLGGVPPLARSDLREQVATVTCRLADLTESGRERVVGGLLDGNAAYLREGTPIYAVVGYDPGCRVAAIRDGVIDAYLAHHEVDNRSVPTECARMVQPISE